jgi:hypothetical protein
MRTTWYLAENPEIYDFWSKVNKHHPKKTFKKNKI